MSAAPRPHPAANPSPPGPAGLRPVRIWDLPTRLFHWLLVAAVVALVITGNVGGNAIDVHAQLGVATGALLVFRLLWGVVGGRWSRFVQFVPGPRTLWRYLRGQAQPQEQLDVGHNPLGALSVLGLLAVLLVQVASGLVIDDEISFTGPLNSWVSSRWVSLASGWHRDWGANLLIGLVLLHVAAIVVHLHVKKHNLVKPMLTGDKLLSAEVPASRDSLLTRLLALVLLAACGVGAWWIWQQGGASVSY